MDRRGFTLLELLVAVALLVAISAIAVPVVVSSLEEGAYDATVELTKAALLRARAHAQSTGRPVEVVYRPDPPRVESRGFDPATGGLEDDDPGAIVAEDWAYRPLASGARLTREPPLDQEERSSLAPDLTEFELEDETTSIRIAVYLPDGSAMLAEPVWIVADAGQSGRLVVNPWSGLPGIDGGGEAVDDEDDEDEDDEDEEEEQEEDRAEDDRDRDDEPPPAEDEDAADPGPEPADEDASAENGAGEDPDDR